jgi:hypothetical protein
VHRVLLYLYGSNNSVPQEVFKESEQLWLSIIPSIHRDQASLDPEDI